MIYHTDTYNPPAEVNMKAYPEYTKDQLIEWAGFIPIWVQEFNVFGLADSLVDHLEERYGFGDLRSRGSDRSSISKSGKMQHPEDDDLDFIVRIDTKLGYTYVYPYGFVAIPQGKKRSHLIVRMD